jgi:alkylhydroperoxidase family enzyme
MGWLLVIHLALVTAHGVTHIAHHLFASRSEAVVIVLLYYVLPAAALLWRSHRAPLALLAFGGSAIHGGLRHFVIASPDRVDALAHDGPGIAFIATAVALLIVDAAGVATATKPALRGLLHGAVASEEKRVRVPSAYLHQIIDASLSAFCYFVVFSRTLASYRRRVPRVAWHVARVLATRAADCGACLQIVVNQARADGVSAEILRGALANDLPMLSAEIAAVQRFTAAVLQPLAEAADNEAALRQEIVRQYGEEGLVELALAIAAVQVFPGVKRTLGQAISCQKVELQWP